MPAPAWENLDAFLALDTNGGFASTATITRQVGDPLSVNGIFDAPYLNAQLGEYEHDTSDPRFLCKEASVPDVSRGDSLTLDSKTYDILDVMPDGTGLVTLKLAPR